MKARSVPVATQRVWYVISASFTGSVEACPCTTMPSESPTSSTSTPAASSTRAKLAS